MKTWRPSGYGGDGWAEDHSWRGDGREPQPWWSRDQFLPLQSGRPFSAALVGTRLAIKGCPGGVRIKALGRQPGAEGPLAIGVGGPTISRADARIHARVTPKGSGLLRKARGGDWLVIEGTMIDRPDQRAMIIEVHSPDGSPPFVVRWLETDHVATVFPSPDAVVVTAADQVAADERAQRRFGSVQSAILHAESE